MMRWANKLFRKKERAPEVKAEAPPQVESGPVAPAPDVTIPTDLLEAVTKFGFQDFFTAEQQNEPHVLQSVTMTKDNYLNSFFNAAHDLVRSAYVERGSYSSRPDYERSRLSPAVSGFLSAQEPETAAAFETLFRFAKKYLKSVAEMEPDPGGGCRTISVAKNGLSNAEGAELKDALDKIWKAAPDSDPRIIEGVDYAMASQPALADAFSGYCWTRNDHRSDYEIAGKTKSHWSPSDPSPKQIAAIARQSAENMALLKPHAKEIAEKTLAWCLSRALDIDKDWRNFDQSRKTAATILDALAGGAGVAEQAKAIESGVYGALHLSPHATDAVEERKRALKVIAAAPEFVALAQDIKSGTWFDAERARLLQRAEEVLWTPAQRAQKEQAAKDRIVEQIVSDATVLHGPVGIKHPLRLKRGEPRVP